MSEQVGYATLQIIPSMKGFGAKLKQQAGRDVEEAGRPAGTHFGKALGIGFVGGLAGGFLERGMEKLREFGSGAVDVYSQVEDATGAAGVVFGKSVGAITSFADTAAAKYGIAKGAALDAALTMGTFGKAAGLTGTKLTGFSTKMAGLAGDLASFRGTSTEQAIEAIGSALRGEMEPIRAYGVLLDDATLRQQALKMGLIKTTKDALTPQQKTLAAQAAILAQTGDAQGDFARTSQSTANTQKALQAATENAQAALGAKLAPALTFVRRGMLGAIKGGTKLIDTVSGIASNMKEAFTFGGDWESHSPFETLAVGARALYDLLVKGDFTSAFRNVFKLDEDSAAVDALFTIRDAAMQLFGYITGTAIPAAQQFGTAVALPALKQVGTFILSSLIPGLVSLAGWMVKNRGTVLAVAGVIAAVLIPHFIALGVTAGVTKVKVGTAWLTTQAGAARAAVVHSFSIMKMIGGWVLMGVQSLLAAGRVAAAWFIALGPIGWVIAAVIGITALVIANWDTIKQWTLTAWSAVSGAVVAAWEWIKSSLAGIASTVGGWISTVAGILGRFFMVVTFPIRLAMAVAATLVLAGWNAIKGYVFAAVGFIRGIIVAYFNVYRAVISAVLGVVLAVVQRVWGGIRAAFNVGANFLRSIVSSAMGFVLAGFHRLSALASLVGGFFGRMVGAVGRKIGELVSAARGIAGKVTGAIGNLGSLLYDKGADIVRGLISGIRGMGGQLAGFVKQFIKDHIPAPVAKALRISSPSKVMAAQAKWIPLGIIEGIDSQRGKLDRTMAGLVKAPAMPALDKAAIGREKASTAGARPIDVDQHFYGITDPEEAATASVNRLTFAVRTP